MTDLDLTLLGNDNLPVYYTGISDGVEDVKKFMLASNQTFNEETASLYMNLIHEEYKETSLAFDAGDRVEVLDGICDLIWTALGLASAMKLPVEAAWKEVRRSNYAKIGSDGKCKFRADGKVLKPEGWTAPRIRELLKEWDEIFPNE